MSFRIIVAVATLAVLPGVSFAQCSQTDKVDQQAMSCIPGTAWDAETSTCKPVVSS